MSERIPKQPPLIKPVTSNNRPQWSVMIPAYNCIQYLKDTLLSVLEQDKGEAAMQIEVIDDYSTDGDVAELVQEVGKGRIKYYRQPQNVGSLRNFETCLNRATGHWIHLLHGDDLVKHGFYAEIEMLFGNYPQAGAAFTKGFYINEKGYETGIERQLKEEPGIIDNWLLKIAVRQRLQPPCIVVKREVYEKLGSFYGAHYGEDWEMWVRIAARYPFAYSPKCLAFYRVHDNNITSRSFISGQYIKDVKTIIKLIQQHIPPQQRKYVKSYSARKISIFLARSANNTYSKNKPAALAKAKGALKLSRNPITLGFVGALYVKHLRNTKKGDDLK